jgi:superfamily II DNA/RNA helicase
VDAQTVRIWLRPDFRGNLRAEGLARDLIWTGGDLPPDAPRFRSDLSRELLDFAFGVFAAAMSLHENGERETAVAAFEAAAEAIESVVRRGRRGPRYAFLAVLGAAAYHLARRNAMATVLVDRDYGERTRSVALFVDVLTHRFGAARARIRTWHDERSVIAEDAGDADDIEIADRALEGNFHRSVAAVLAFFATGDRADLLVARERLRLGVECAGRWGILEAWWLHRLTDLMLDDFEERSLHRCVPQSPDPDLAALRARFIAALGARANAEVDLWPSQLAAVDAVFDDSDLVLALPTSAGKTRIAELCMLPALAAGRRVVYVSPLRALSAQLERELRDLFGRVDRHIGVSRLYDPDATHGEGAPRIAVCTPERLDFQLRHDPQALDDVGLVVFDEGHLIGPQPRELRYELLIERVLRLRAGRPLRVVCLSALLPPQSVEDYAEWLAGEEHTAIPRQSDWRPSRLNWGTVRWRRNHARLDLEVENERPFLEHFVDAARPAGRRARLFPADDRELLLASALRLAEHGESVLIFCPNRRTVEPLAFHSLTLERQGLVRIPPFDPAQIHAHERAILTEWLGDDHRVTRCLLRGVAVHHGNLPAPVLGIVERLMRERRAVLVVASPTVAQGLNVTASTVFFESLRRRDAAGVYRLISPEEFLNVVGRAGRAFVDLAGKVVFSTGLAPAAARHHERDWQTLRVTTFERTLESGLATLVIRLMERLGGFTDERAEFLAEHVNVDRTMNGEAIDPEDEAQYNAEVDELDRSLNAILGDAELGEEEAAQYLDEIMRSSLFRRTLDKKPAAMRRVVHAVVERRARLIARRFTAAQRSAAYLSDIAPRLSERFSELAEALAPAVAEIEAAISLNAVTDHVLGLLSEVCAALLAFPTFAPSASRQVDDPAAITLQWLRGAPLNAIAELDGKARTFIEDGVRMRAVWGYEALWRAVMQEDERRLTAALLFITGVPTVAAAMLVREGLDSRATAARVGAVVPHEAVETTTSLREWLAANLDTAVEAAGADDASFHAFRRRFLAEMAPDRPEMLFVEPFAAPPEEDSVVFIFVDAHGVNVTDRDLRTFASGEPQATMSAVLVGRWLGDGLVDVSDPGR